MMGAAELGHESVVQLLLDAKAKVDAVNRKGRSAVSFAAAPSKDESSQHRASQIGVIQLLTRYNANVDLRDRKGTTALDYAVRSLDKEEHVSRSDAVDLLRGASMRT